MWTARPTFPREGTQRERGGPEGTVTSHEMPADNTYGGQHGSVRLLQTALIMRPCGPQIHSHRQEHVFNRRGHHCSETAERWRKAMKKMIAVCARGIQITGEPIHSGQENEKTTHTHFNCSVFV